MNDDYRDLLIGRQKQRESEPVMSDEYDDGTLASERALHQALSEPWPGEPTHDEAWHIADRLVRQNAGVPVDVQRERIAEALREACGARGAVLSGAVNAALNNLERAEAAEARLAKLEAVAEAARRVDQADEEMYRIGADEVLAFQRASAQRDDALVDMRSALAALDEADRD